MFNYRLSLALAYLAATLSSQHAEAFTSQLGGRAHSTKIAFSTNVGVALITPSQTRSSLYASETATEVKVGGFIETELRGAAMRLHTRKQAPKEGEAPEKPQEKVEYVTTHADYLAFLVDSQVVFQALEDAVESSPKLEVFRNTGLERVAGLETDIKFMIEEFGLDRPEGGKGALEYAELIRNAAAEDRIPEFMCHYYNFYFAHTAGGRMIGKQMSALLLNKKTLEFYKVGIKFDC